MYEESEAWTPAGFLFYCDLNILQIILNNEADSNPRFSWSKLWDSESSAVCFLLVLSAAAAPCWQLEALLIHTRVEPTLAASLMLKQFFADQ